MATPLTTAERAAALALAAARFPLLGRVTKEDLLALVALELGHEEALDRFLPYSPYSPHSPQQFTKALAPASLLHIISGNTPHGALQTVLRGLLLGSHNRCKLPSGVELPEVAQFLALLPPALAALVETSTTLPPEWLKEADAVVAFGSDETIAHFQRQLRPGQRFVAHGHRISLGVVLDDPSFASVEQAARDAALYDQQGCLSPHVFYVASDNKSDGEGSETPPFAFAHEYARQLAAAMARLESELPRGAAPLEAQSAIAAFRDEYRFRAAIDPQVTLWESPGSTAWSVVFDPAPEFRPSPLYRTVIVKPLPVNREALLATLCAALAPIRQHLSTLALTPFSLANAESLAATGAPRLCPIGSMQFPSPFWHHDGEAVLQPLVRWVDLDGGHASTT